METKPISFSVAHQRATAPAVDPVESAAIKFEAFFIKNMLDSSRIDLPGDDFLDKSNDREVYEDMQNQMMSEHLATSKTYGIADLLIKQVKK